MAKQSISSIYHTFSFKPSKLAYFIHFIAMLILQWILYATVDIQLWTVLFSLQILCSTYFIIQQQHYISLSYLDKNYWILSERVLSPIKHTKKLQYKIEKHHIQILNMIDHSLYIVIYYQKQNKQHSIIIWQDQLEAIHWKALKTQALLKHY